MVDDYAFLFNSNTVVGRALDSMTARPKSFYECVSARCFDGLILIGLFISVIFCDELSLMILHGIFCDDTVNENLPLCKPNKYLYGKHLCIVKRV